MCPIIASSQHGKPTTRCPSRLLHRGLVQGRPSEVPSRIRPKTADGSSDPAPRCHLSAAIVRYRPRRATRRQRSRLHAATKCRPGRRHRQPRRDAAGEPSCPALLAAHMPAPHGRIMPLRHRSARLGRVAAQRVVAADLLLTQKRRRRQVRGEVDVAQPRPCLGDLAQ